MPTMRKFSFNKLGRDRLFKKWLSEGVIAKTIILDDAAYFNSLKDKLLEEAQEVAVATPHELQEELADVLEVVHAIAQAAGFSMESIEKARETKYEVRGGFQERTFVEWAQFPEGHPTIAYCLQNADRYPEIVDEKVQ